MPHIINGIGTWYHGKRNLIQATGKCDQCGNVVLLSSYDTRLCFVIFLIPVVPLGRKRILEDCPACRAHKVMPLDQWESQRAKSCQDAREAYLKSPEDVEAAKNAIGVTVGYQNPKMLSELAEKMVSHFTGTPVVLNQIADAFSYFGKYAETTKLLRLSLAAEDKEETRERLAESLLELGEPDEARQLVSHVIDREIPDKLYLLCMLAEAYQTKGEHAKALEMLDAATLIVPQILKDKEFIKSKRLSEKHLKSGKKIRSKRSPSAAIKMGDVREASTIFQKLAAIALFVGLAGTYFGSAYYIGSHREVWLVSGLDQPYTVQLDKTAFSMPPYGRKRIAISEGSYKVSIAEDETAIKPFEVEIVSNFWMRPFADKTFVINPDRLAVLHVEDIIYVQDGARIDESKLMPQSSYHFGKTFYQFGKIHYPFQEPDSRLENMSGSKSTRVVMRCVTGAKTKPSEMVGWLSLEARSGKVIEFAEIILERTPDDMMAVSALSATLGHEKFLERATKELDVTPTQVNWHRLYQDAMEELGRKDSLAENYRQRLEARPDDAELAYLYARALPPGEIRTAAVRKAVEFPSASPYAHLLACWEAGGIGDFAAASDHAMKSLERDLDFPSLPEPIIEALVGADRLDELDQLLDNQLDDGNYHTLGTKLYIMLQQGKSDDEIGKVIISEVAQIASLNASLRDDYIKGFKKYVKGMRLYTDGQFKEYAALFNVRGEPIPIQAFLALGDARAAFEAHQAVASDLNQAEDNSKLSYAISGLEIYLAAKLTGDEKTASLAIAESSKWLAESGPDHREMATWLTQDVPPEADRLIHASLVPSQKSVTLAALIVRHPTLREPCLPLLEKLNIWQSYPRHILDAVIKERPLEILAQKAEEKQP